MPKICAVVPCHSSGRMRERKFYRFPLLNNTSARTLAITQIRQELWVRALNRIDFPPTRYKHATICDLHFVSGRSASYTDVKNVDWVPTLLLGHETVQTKAKNTEEELSALQSEYETYQIKTEPSVDLEDNDSNDPLQLNELHQSGNVEEFTYGMNPDDIIDSVLEDVTEDALDSDNADTPERDQDTPLSFEYVSLDTIGTQTDDTITGMSSDILLSCQAKIAHLEAMLCGRVDEQCYEDVVIGNKLKTH